MKYVIDNKISFQIKLFDKFNFMEISNSLSTFQQHIRLSFSCTAVEKFHLVVSIAITNKTKQQQKIPRANDGFVKSAEKSSVTFRVAIKGAVRINTDKPYPKGELKKIYYIFLNNVI